MKHSHYFKDVSHLSSIDVYRTLALFSVTDQAIGHAVKKLLVAGGRGVKDMGRDVQEAIDTLVRWQAMAKEDAAVSVAAEPAPVTPPAAKPITVRLQGCYNHPPYADWFEHKGTAIPNVMSKGRCKYDLRESDPACNGCRWITAPVEE